jgi:hypothetical protein
MSETAPEPEVKADTDGRLTRLEQAVDKILGIVSSKSAAHGDAEKVTQERLDEPGSVAEEVQRELERRDEAAKREQREAEFGQVKDTVARLTETKPRSPVRKIESVMGYHG